MHRRIIEHNFAYANTLDPLDSSEGRTYPKWMPDYAEKPLEPSSLDNLFDI